MIWDKMFLFERIAAATATAHPVFQYKPRDNRYNYIP